MVNVTTWHLEAFCACEHLFSAHCADGRFKPNPDSLTVLTVYLDFRQLFNRCLTCLLLLLLHVLDFGHSSYQFEKLVFVELLVETAHGG